MKKFYESKGVHMEYKKYSDEDWSESFHSYYAYTMRGDTLAEYLEALCSHTTWESPDNTDWDFDDEVGAIRVYCLCVYDERSGHIPAAARQIEEQQQGLRDDLYEVEYTVYPERVSVVPCVELSTLMEGDK